MCAAGTEEHRAWVLPLSRLALYEVCHDSDTVAVVTAAAVVDAAKPPAARKPPRPNEVPGSSRNDPPDSATGT